MKPVMNETINLTTTPNSHLPGWKGKLRCWMGIT